MLFPREQHLHISWNDSLISKSLAYVRTKVQYELSRTPTAVRETNNGADIALQRDGIVVLPWFFSWQQIATLRDSIPQDLYVPTPEMQHSAHNPLADKLISNAEKIQGLESFFHNQQITDIVHSYLSKNAIPGRNFVRTKKDTWPVASFENFYHFDSIKNRVKVFLYLGDVTWDNAPVAYLRWTHKLWLWKLKQEIEMHAGYRKNQEWYAQDDTSSYIWCYWPHEVEVLKQKYGFTENIVTWNAWTVIIFDAKWLHKATQLLSGERSILMTHWFMPNHHT